MILKFRKYHALGNSFLVIRKGRQTLSKARLSRLARLICDGRTGVGADGIVYLSPDRKTDGRIDIFNADGGWAEKSGNGLRIAAVDTVRMKPRKKTFLFQTGSGSDRVILERKIEKGYIVTTQLGQPGFLATDVPVRTRSKYLINGPIRIGSITLEATCLSVGNPHTVILVDNFDFDWRLLGAQIETARPFPNGTNVEFVKALSRKKIRVAEWERGAGATGSSGTGAAAAVCAMVMLGMVNRLCEVEFETGLLTVDWNSDTNLIELTGPARYIMEGSYDFR